MKQLRTTPWLGLRLAAALLVCAARPALAQRMQFPTMVEQTQGSGAQTFSASPPPSYTPYSGQPAGPGYGAPPPSTPLGPPATYAAPPPVQPGPPPAWDAYGPPGQPYSPTSPSPYAPTPQPLYPEGAPTVFPDNSVFSTLGQPLRFFQELRVRGTWLAGDAEPGTTDLGVTDLELSGTFAFPFFSNQSPLLVTPGFNAHYWDGPNSAGPAVADLPPRTYDAFLDFAWYPQITTWLAANLGVRVGVFSDFQEFNSDSLRVMGRALAVMTFTPTIQLAAGVIYVDRLDVKLLPAGGVIWTPIPDARYEILFPNPKLARRLTTIGTTDVWGYLAGEFGGGSWSIERADGSEDAFDYNDIRIIFGIETSALSGLKTNFEIGYVFNREIIYKNGPPPDFEPNDTLMLRAGLAY